MSRGGTADGSDVGCAPAPPSADAAALAAAGGLEATELTRVSSSLSQLSSASSHGDGGSGRPPLLAQSISQGSTHSQPPTGAARPQHPHTAALEECLFGAETVSLARLRKLSSSGVHDLISEEHHNTTAASWRGLGWRLLLGYLPGAVDTTRTMDNKDWAAALQTKRQVYYDLVRAHFQSDYDTMHGAELLPAANRSAAEESSRIDESDFHRLTTDPGPEITPSVKEEWRRTGRDLHILEGLTRGPNALVVPTDPSSSSSTTASTSCESASPLVRSALLLDQIRKDVVRTHADLAFFVDPKLGRRRYAALERILLCACAHSHTSYVQGMNEIVATLYYALATTTRVPPPPPPEAADAEAADSAATPPPAATAALAREDWAAHAEVDTYWLFRILLDDIHAVYNRELDDDDSGIRGRLLAMENLLKKHDPEVMEHLTEHGLDTSLFAIRWWTTLLSREFLLPDTMRLWDSMFASTHRDNFLRYVCVTMVMTVRDSLLTGDFSRCLRLLQSFPPTHVERLLQATRALWVYESQVTVACHRGGISLHQALETIAPPPALIMAFGLKAGSVQQLQQQSPELADIAAERVRDVAAHANVWLGRAKSSFAQWNKNRSRSSGELGQPGAAGSRILSTRSLDRTSGRELAAHASSIRSGRRHASATAPSLSEDSSLEENEVDDVYLQAIQKSQESSD